MYATQHPQQVKLGLSVPSGSPIIALREQLQSDTGIPLEQIILTEITDKGFSRVFCDSHPLSTLCEDDQIYCIEAPASITTTKSTTATIANTSSSNSTGITTNEIENNNRQQLKLLIANVQRQNTINDKNISNNSDDDVKRFGTPFCINVNRDISYNELQKRLLKEMQSVLKSEVFKYTVSASDLFKIRLQDPSADPDTYLEQNVNNIFILYMLFKLKMKYYYFFFWFLG